VKRVLPLLALSLLGPVLSAEKPKELLNVSYGVHGRQALDSYQAKSDNPTPVVFKINPRQCLDRRISVAVRAQSGEAQTEWYARTCSK